MARERTRVVRIGKLRIEFTFDLGYWGLGFIWAFFDKGRSSFFINLGPLSIAIENWDWTDAEHWRD